MMRKSVSLLVLLIAFAACATSNRAASRSNAQLVRALYEAFGKGDIPTVVGSLDPGVVWLEAENVNYADRNPYHGPQAVLDGIFKRIGEDWSSFRVVPEKFVEEGDTVVSIGRYMAPAHTATGHPLNAQFVHVWTLRDNKVVRFQQYTDTAQFARATGAWK